jgi:threonine dehydrogenase-like Zn-dependent dehydrogenase
MPPAFTFEMGALIEPAAVAMHAPEKSELRPGESVVVVGAGTIGQLCAQACRSTAAGLVILLDPLPGRRRLALELGADAAVSPAEAAPNRLLGGPLPPHGADLVLDTASSPESFAAALALLRRGGRYVAVGEATRPATWDLNLLAFCELRLTGVNMHLRRHFEAAVRAISTGDLRVAPLVSDVLGLSEAPAAFRRLEHEPDSAVKLMLAPVSWRIEAGQGVAPPR